MYQLTSRTATAAVALGLLVGATAPALGSGGGGDVRRSGHCSVSSVWKVKAKADDGRLEVEGEVDSNTNGQTWTWRILHNGGVSAHGTRTTRAPSGSFSVERRLVDVAGADRIGWRASNRATGESCRGSLTI